MVGALFLWSLRSVESAARAKVINVAVFDVINELSDIYYIAGGLFFNQYIFYCLMSLVAYNHFGLFKILAQTGASPALLKYYPGYKFMSSVHWLRSVIAQIY